MAKKDNIPSVLAFEKKLVPSDGYLYGTTWEHSSQPPPLRLVEKSVRGTISNRLEQAVKGDPAKLNAEVEKANLQRVDACALSPKQDTLKLDFTLKILGGIAEPSACNDTEFKQTYKSAVKKYVTDHGFRELAKRYASNIANGRFLWRNRVGAENIKVEVKVLNREGEQLFWVFDGKQISTRDFDHEDADVTSLAKHIADALSSDDDFLMLDITCFSHVGLAQEVYPSEELVLDKGKKVKGDKSKVLYAVDGIAAMHSQKIGNALRSIDTWYPDFSDEDKTAGPIAIEPYGAVTNLGEAYRKPNEEQDFYTFFDKWARGGTLDRVEDEHYVMAVLVRGGIFGKKSGK